MDPAETRRPPSPTPHPVHTVGGGPAVADVNPHDPGAGHSPAHGADKPQPYEALLHPKDAAHSAAERNKLAKAQGHTSKPAGGSGGG
jgi:hypothetical protein